MNRVVRKASGGQSFIEFAIVLPLLLLLGLGVFEFGRAIQAKNIITNMSREAANLASRTTDDPQYIINAIASTAQPLNMSSNGMIYITQVIANPDLTIKVVAQYKWVGTYQPTSKVLVGTCTTWGTNAVCSGVCRVCTKLPSPPSVDPSVLLLDQSDPLHPALASGQTAYAVEVFYNYQVIFRRIINYSPQLYSLTVL
jgi:Flp pilus assembly protein TadG